MKYDIKMIQLELQLLIKKAHIMKAQKKINQAELDELFHKLVSQMLLLNRYYEIIRFSIARREITSKQQELEMRNEFVRLELFKSESLKGATEVLPAPYQEQWVIGQRDAKITTIEEAREAQLSMIHETNLELQLYFLTNEYEQLRTQQRQLEKKSAKQEMLELEFNHIFGIPGLEHANQITTLKMELFSLTKLLEVAKEYVNLSNGNVTSEEKKRYQDITKTVLKQTVQLLELEFQVLGSKEHSTKEKMLAVLEEATNLLLLREKQCLDLRETFLPTGKLDTVFLTKEKQIKKLIQRIKETQDSEEKLVTIRTVLSKRDAEIEAVQFNMGNRKIAIS